MRALSPTQEGKDKEALLCPGVVVFVMLMSLGFLVHGFFLAPDYTRLARLFRSEEGQKYMPSTLRADTL